MRFCPFWGAETADERATCSACGRRLPPLPPRRARNAPPTGIQLPQRPAGASQALPAGAVRPASPTPGLSGGRNAPVVPSGPSTVPGIAVPTAQLRDGLVAPPPAPEPGLPDDER